MSEELTIGEEAHAQANATQTMLMALLHLLRGKLLADELLSETFDLAAETHVVTSYEENKMLAAQATRTLQVIEDMRQSLFRTEKHES
jgi:hypothetical protein